MPKKGHVMVSHLACGMIMGAAFVLFLEALASDQRGTAELTADLLEYAILLALVGTAALYITRRIYR